MLNGGKLPVNWDQTKKSLKAAIDVLKTFQGDKVATGTFVSALAKGANGKAP